MITFWHVICRIDYFRCCHQRSQCCDPITYWNVLLTGLQYQSPPKIRVEISCQLRNHCFAKNPKIAMLELILEKRFVWSVENWLKLYCEFWKNKTSIYCGCPNLIAVAFITSSEATLTSRLCFVTFHPPSSRAVSSTTVKTFDENFYTHLQVRHPFLLFDLIIFRLLFFSSSRIAMTELVTTQTWRPQGVINIPVICDHFCKTSWRSCRTETLHIGKSVGKPNLLGGWIPCISWVLERSAIHGENTETG